MTSMRQGSIHLFRIAGVDVFLHWSWFLVAAFEISGRTRTYSSLSWNILEYLALFSIVLLHEYGHALACRQVGGIANRIVLWPLGGVAYVDPPPRPGATLWSIAAGPLVNVVLFFVLTLTGMLGRSHGWFAAVPNIHTLLRAIWYINLGLLTFNLLPIYPLVCAGPRSKPDGGCQHWVHWRGRTYRPRVMDTLRLVRCSVLLHLDELLGRTKTGAIFIPPCKF